MSKKPKGALPENNLGKSSCQRAAEVPILAD